jgi:hypothetical protein
MMFSMFPVWGMQLELEDVLPWKEFSLRLPQFMLYRLPEALQILMDEPDRVGHTHYCERLA